LDNDDANAKYPLLLIAAVAILFAGSAMVPADTVKPLLTTSEPLSVIDFATKLLFMVVPLEAEYDIPVRFVLILLMEVFKAVI
jgi:hypothetical protein